MDLSSDKRLGERAVRKGQAATPEAGEPDAPDLSEQLRVLSDADLEQVRGELIAEHTIRSERIQAQLAEDKSARREPEIPVVAIPENEI